LVVADIGELLIENRRGTKSFEDPCTSFNKKKAPLQLQQRPQLQNFRALNDN